MAGQGAHPIFPERIVPGIVEALHRHPEYSEVLTIGASLADWAVAGV